MSERRFFRNRRAKLLTTKKEQPFRPIAAPLFLLSSSSPLVCLECYLSITAEGRAMKEKSTRKKKDGVHSLSSLSSVSPAKS